MEVVGNRLNGHKAALEPKERPSRFKPMSMLELELERPTIEYDIDGIFVAGQPCAILGQSKTLKTTVMLELALALATGGKFLGQFQANRKRRVCVMSAESGLPTIAETLRRQAVFAGVDAQEVGDSLTVVDRTPVLSDSRDLLELGKMLDDCKPDVLAIDPLYLSVKADNREGSLYHMGEILKGVTDVLNPRGVTLVLVHHMKESRSQYAGARPGRLQDSAWSGLEQFARQWLAISRRKEFRPGSGQHSLWLEAGGSAGHSSRYALEIAEGIAPNRTWDVVVEAQTAEGEAKPKPKTTISRMLEALVKYPEGETLTTIAKDIGSNATRLKTTADELVNNGKLERIETIKAGKPVATYKVITL